MVILQFNKLIRNKWFWGAFAVVISAAFCFDGLFTTNAREQYDAKTVGKLNGKSVSADDFSKCVSEVRGFGRNRDDRSSPAEVNLKAWQNLAALETAGRDGVFVSDAQLATAVRDMFGSQAPFDFGRYRMMVAELGLTPERFEDFYRRQLIVQEGMLRTLVGSGVWVSPMELDQQTYDVTDLFTVRVARFTQDRAAADAIKADDAMLKKWYDDNVKSLALPALAKLRLVRFDATKPELLAKMTVSDDEMHDLYDTNSDKYTTTDTNGVEKVKAFEEVKDELEKELRQIAAVEYLETNLTSRAYLDFAEGEDRKASRLLKIAAEEGLKPQETGWVALDGSYVEGFTAMASAVAPGVDNFLDAIAELDMDNVDFRYQVLRSDNAVWLVEKIAEQEPKTPSFEEAKGKIVARALRDAKADAFKKEIEAIAAKGADAVLASKDVSTNLTFAVCDMSYGMFPDQRSVAGAAVKLKKGEVSEFVPTGLGRGLLVVCVDRQPGDAARAVMIRSSLRNQIGAAAFRDISSKWLKWNLERLTFETGSESSVTEAEDEESVEDAETEVPASETAS